MSGGRGGVFSWGWRDDHAPRNAPGVVVEALYNGLDVGRRRAGLKRELLEHALQLGPVEGVVVGGVELGAAEQVHHSEVFPLQEIVQRHKHARGPHPLLGRGFRPVAPLPVRPLRLALRLLRRFGPAGLADRPVQLEEVERA